MNGWFRRYVVGVGLAMLLVGHTGLSVMAQVTLPDGVVAGLPSDITAMDSEGNVVNSDTGEYFFHVEDMTAGEVYTKNIQIMNLREDKAYHIYFYAAPLARSGEIDLEQTCTANISLDGTLYYTGKITGEGDRNIAETPLDLGLYEPGQSRTLSCSIVWNGLTAEDGGHVDFGHRLVDADGTTYLRDPSGNTSISGEATFRWIFYAVVDESYTPPKTGVFFGGSAIYLVALAVLGVMILFVGLLILLKKRRREQKETV